MLPDTVSEADAWKMANFSLERLERWVTDYCAACEAPEPIGNVLSSADISASSVKPIPAIMMPLAGLPNTYDLVGQIDEVLKRGEQVDMSLNFFYEPQFEAIVGTASTMASSFPVQDNADILAVPSGVLLGGDDFFIDAPPSVTLHGWRLQFRGPDNHPLGSCVTQFVKHYNIELFRRQSNGSYKYVTNLHIGAYRSGGRRCFVLWNNLRPVVCWKICSPTWEQLKQMLSWVLIAAAAIVGIALAAWVIAAIASAASSALWLPLLALA